MKHWKIKCPCCKFVHDESQHKYTVEQIAERGITIQSGKFLLIFCGPCRVFYEFEGV